MVVYPGFENNITMLQSLLNVIHPVLLIFVVYLKNK